MRVGPVEVDTGGDIVGNGGVHTSGERLADIIVADDETLGVGVAGADKIVHFVGTAGYVEGDVLGYAGTRDIIDPVGLFPGVVIGQFQFTHPVDGIGFPVGAGVHQLDVLLSVPELGLIVHLGEA